MGKLRSILSKILDPKTLFRDEEYWYDRFHAEIAKAMAEFQDNKDLANHSRLAESLGVTKGRVSQMLSDDYNPTVKTLISVASKIDRAVQISLVDYQMFEKTQHSPMVTLKVGFQNQRSVFVKDSTDIKETELAETTWKAPLPVHPRQSFEKNPA